MKAAHVDYTIRFSRDGASAARAKVPFPDGWVPPLGAPRPRVMPDSPQRGVLSGWLVLLVRWSQGVTGFLRSGLSRMVGMSASVTIHSVFPTELLSQRLDRPCIALTDGPTRTTSCRLLRVGERERLAWPRFGRTTSATVNPPREYGLSGPSTPVPALPRPDPRDQARCSGRHSGGALPGRQPETLYQPGCVRALCGQKRSWSRT